MIVSRRTALKLILSIPLVDLSGFASAAPTGDDPVPLVDDPVPSIVWPSEFPLGFPFAFYDATITHTPGPVTWRTLAPQTKRRK